MRLAPIVCQFVATKNMFQFCFFLLSIGLKEGKPSRAFISLIVSNVSPDIKKNGRLNIDMMCLWFWPVHINFKSKWKEGV